jgi:hypothetical protein
VEKIRYQALGADNGLGISEKTFPEWIQFQKILDDFSGLGHVHQLGVSKKDHQELPVMGMSFGSRDPKAPVLGLFAGVHGLERIGSQVVLSLLQSFAESLLWDESLKQTLTEIRILFVPIINPWGILDKSRSNPNGVDLMRNSPIEAEEKPTWLVGGHHLSAKLPWYRGKELQSETKAVIDFCREQFFQSEAVISLDFHSGFGLQDQIWFPFAKTTKAFPHLAENFRLFENFERSYPNHVYKIEPQSLNYTTHGDLWDYLYQEFSRQSDRTYLPLCLEMGSWLWVKKNPLQILSKVGPFNPIKSHRQKRTLRRHIPLFDYLIRATRSAKTWAILEPEQKNKYFQQGLEKWYKQ